MPAGAVVLDAGAVISDDVSGQLLIDPIAGGWVDVGGTQVKNVAPPTASTDAASKAYVDAFAGVSVPDMQVFLVSGTWTKPAGAKLCRVICIGAGGQGGSGRRGAAGTVRQGGGGGSGGGLTIRDIPASVLGATETATVGTTGTGGAAVSTDNTDGVRGARLGNSFFGPTTAATTAPWPVAVAAVGVVVPGSRSPP